MDLDKAYEILELENPTKDKKQIEKKFERLLKKYKNKEVNNIDDGKNINEITEAYMKIIESIDGKQTVEIDTREKKIEHFWTYYKFYVIVPIISIILVAFFVKTVVFKEEPELNIIVQGDYTGYGESIEDEFTKMTDKIDGIGVIMIMLNDRLDATTYSRNLMKSAALTQSKHAQFYILDKTEYERIGEEDVYANLKDILDIDGVDESRLLNGDKKDVVEGIKLENLDFIKEKGVKGQDFYLVVFRNSNLLKAENEESKKVNNNIIEFMNKMIKK